MANTKFFKIFSFFLFVFCLQSSNYVLAQTDSTTQLILKGIDFASTLKYEKAIEVFDKIIELEPENPRGYFLKSATYFWIFSTDMHNEAMGDTLKEWSLKAVEVAEKKLAANDKDIDALFYLGGAYGTLGRYYGATKSYLKAYWYGQKGKNYLEEVVKMDSTYYDAYLGLGIYHYLADVLPKFVKILSFILGVDGNKDQGISELYLAAEKGLYTKTEAMFFLGAIYTYRERDFNKAVDIFNKLLKKYPDNCGALIHLGRCYSFMGKCELALKTFFKILNSEDSDNRIPLTSLHYQMGDVYFKMNNFYYAIGSFTIAVESDTSKSGSRRWTYPWSLYKLGLCYELIGKRDRAEYYYKKIDEEDNQRAYDEAQKKLRKPMNAIDISILQNKNYSDCGKHSIALEAFQNLYENIKDSDTIQSKYYLSEIDFYLGKTKYEVGRYEESIIHFRKVIKNNIVEENLISWAHYLLGNCYKKTGFIDRAIEEYDLASETDDYDLLNRINKEMQTISE